MSLSNPSQRRMEGNERDQQDEIALLAKPVGEHIKTIQLLDPEEIESHSSITDCRFIASYNWMEPDDTDDPTISIPGMPPRFIAHDLPIRITEDEGDYFCDTNAAYLPETPLEPAMRAVRTMNPILTTLDVDIFACSHTLNQLLSFAGKPDARSGSVKDFRFNLEVLGSTVFFVRTELSPTRCFQGVTGYNHNFAEKFCVWERELENSATHQRIIKYIFGGLSFLVRSACDGYLDDEENEGGGEGEQYVPDYPHLNLGSDLRINSSTALTIPPQSAIFDLKTRSERNELNPQNVLPKMWLAQVPNIVYAKHNAGNFSNIIIDDLSPRFKPWEEDHSAQLKRFEGLLNEIVRVAKNADTSKMVVIGRGNGLEIWVRSEEAEDANWAVEEETADWWARSGDGLDVESNNDQ